MTWPRSPQFDEAVARATWLAEKYRADEEGREMDLETLRAAFEHDTLKWPVFKDDWRSHVGVFAAWAFKEKGSAAWKRELVRKKEHEAFPVPEALNSVAPPRATVSLLQRIGHETAMSVVKSIEEKSGMPFTAKLECEHPS